VLAHDGESCQVYLCLQRHGGPSQAHIRFERGFASKVQSRLGNSQYRPR
jgi:hypothetical protein